ncbi:DUF1302 domain-containing protein [Massilia brevitalea]|uniref:DUF1302 domain-containing protein n=1 Tax=Massilia brevitalea TaxID=442526 RepID=UPI002739A2A2|nr:DUF1302 family protein [Massilia brevitalea]
MAIQTLARNPSGRDSRPTRFGVGLGLGLGPDFRCARALPGAALLGLALASPSAQAVDAKLSGRVMFGAVARSEARDSQLLTGVNAAAIGLQGFGSGGNGDDGNMNFGRGDLASLAWKATLDLDVRQGPWSALVRVKAWRDEALERRKLPWGNSINGYAPHAPLEDDGAARLARFSGVALGDAWLQYAGQAGAMRYSARLGRQSLNWGERSITPGGLEALNPRDLPATRRAGAIPQEMRAPAPMLLGRVELTPALGVEAYYQTRHQPTALDLCGSLWSTNDYLAPGCDLVMSGPPPVNDRARIPLGAYQKRLPTPVVNGPEYGVALGWKSAALATDFGLYHARYNARTALPSLRRSARPGGPALVPGDPDGRNMAYFSEYPQDLAITALTFQHKRGKANVYGEASYRPRQPFMLAPGDVLPPFLNATVPALLRADADAVPPGGVYHGYDLHPMSQLQLGVQREWQAGPVALAATAEVVGKHASGLPDQAVRRYGRADIFGVGPVNGACNVTTGNAARQCSLRGYASTNAWGYRLRVDARLPNLLPTSLSGLACNASLALAHDVKGWSGDFLLNEGRKTATAALRFEYRQRYLLELAWAPTWGGDYNPVADRDVVALAAGVRF